MSSADFTNTTMRITFNAVSSGPMTVSVPVAEDVMSEDMEVFSMELTVANSSIINSTAVLGIDTTEVTITNNDGRS